MEELPSREQEILEARAENQDALQASWRALIQALMLSCEGDYAPDHDTERFIPTILAFAEFVRICHKRKDFYQRAQRLVLLDNLVKIMRFTLPAEPPKGNIQARAEYDAFMQNFGMFCRKLKSFIKGTKEHFQSLRNEEDCAHFSLLRDWIDDVLEAAVPDYNPLFTRKAAENQGSAKFYCKEYRRRQKEKTQTLTRIGPAVAIFLACHSVKGTEAGNFDLFRKNTDRMFSLENLLEIRSMDIMGRFDGLKLKLAAAGKLTQELDDALSDEQSTLLELLPEDPCQTLRFATVDRILLLLRDMLAQDEAAVLDDFVLVGQTILKPNENLYTVICRELFVNPDAESEELKMVEGQATVLGTAIQALGAAYSEFEQNFNQECKNLLGETDLLHPRALLELLENYTSPIARLNILEQMYASIENGEIVYEENSRLKLEHIILLQNFYLDIIRARPSEMAKELVLKSKLLTIIPGTDDDTKSARDIALRLLDEASSALSRSPRAIRK